MNIDKAKMLSAKGYFEGGLDAVDEATALVAGGYKKNICRNFIAINPEQIDFRVGGEEFYITRKYDGEMNVIFFDGSSAFTINTGGKVRMGIPCIEDAGKALKKAGIKSAVIPAELYVCEKDGRTRVFDVLSALSKEDEIGKLCLAPFDIIEIDDSPFKSNNYGEVYLKLQDIFGNTEAVRPVSYTKASSKAEIKDIFGRWVEEEGSEGLVVRSELPLVYKIKPKHNLDVVVVGYTEGSAECKGQIRTLLLALMIDENTYQIIGKTGNGFSDSQKKDLFTKLSEIVIESDYIETDSNHVAFRMVRPETVMEISYNDILFEGSSSKISNPLLKINEARFKLVSACNGISLIYPIFIRLREDKKAVWHDVRLSQITDIFYVPDICSSGVAAELPKSEIIIRDVYKKESKGKLMVQKFMVWKTNKENADKRYPAFVMHYTNFSSDRKEPLQREIRISNSREQILEIFEEFIAENVKKGWIKVEE